MHRLLPVFSLLALLSSIPAGAAGILWDTRVPCPGTWDKFLTPRWSPDGKRVLVTSTSSYDLFVVDPAAGSVTPLRTGAGTGLGAAWGEGGRTVRFLRPGPGPGMAPQPCAIDLATGRSEVLPPLEEGAPPPGEGLGPVLSADGSRRGFSGEGLPRDIRRSPDGRWLAFIAPREGHNHLFICRASAPEETPRDLGPGFNPRWTRDGRIAYCVSEQDRVTEEVRVSDLYLADPAAPPGSEPAPLTATPALLEAGFDLSPQGGAIACEERKSGDLLFGRLP